MTVNYSVNGAPTSVTLSNINDSISVSPNSSSIYDFTSLADPNCLNNINDQVSISINPVPNAVISGGGSVCDDGSQVDVFINIFLEHLLSTLNTLLELKQNIFLTLDIIIQSLQMMLDFIL